MSTRLHLIVLMIVVLAGTAQATVYVKSDSPGPSFDGNSWQTAYHTIQQAVTDAGVSTEAVWVARGTYAEKVSVAQAIEIYGGFAGTEASMAQRDWTANATIVDAGGIANAFTVSADARIDGLTITNGEYGIFSESCSPAVINNTITGCKAFGIYCFAGSPNISNNSITGNSFGIGCESGSALISHNTFTGNSEYSIYCLSGSNVVLGNTMQSSYGGVYSSSGALNAEGNRIQTNATCGIYCCEGASAALASNLLIGNDDGIRTDAINAEVTNNTVVSSNRYGIYWHDGSPTIANSIVVYNATGLDKFGGSETILRNDVYQNGRNYGGSITAVNEIPMSADPLFVNGTAGDYHLTPLSPCINAGLNSVDGLPTFDMDGEGRIYGGSVDFGADEYWSSVFNPVEARKAPEGAIIQMDGGIVSAAFTDFLYMEREDQASGIRIDKATHGMSEKAKVNITGKVRTDGNGERYVAADSVTTDGSTGDIKPLAIPNKSLGGAAVGLQDGVSSWQWNMYPGDIRKYEWTQSPNLSNIGLLVTIWGSVTTVGDGYIYIDDGSHLDDGTLTGTDENIGVRVICDPTDCGTGDYLVVTGISSCFKTPSGLATRILTSKSEDIREVPL